MNRDSRAIIKTLELHGWQTCKRGHGTSHIVMKHQRNPNVVSFPKQSKDLTKGLVSKIKRLTGVNL